MEPFTRQVGPWTISHVPGGASAYDRVIGRMTSWSIQVEHDSGWRIIEGEGEPDARVISPGGLLVGVVVVSDYAPGPANPASLTTSRSEVLTQALRSWVSQNAESFGESSILD